MLDGLGPPRPATYDKKVALVLQGGGALGSYQAGVYELIAASEYQPDWVAGISIGAVNAALIAGNRPSERVAQMRRFWEEVTSPTSAWFTGLSGSLAAAQRNAAATSALMFGQPGFFTPKTPLDWLSGSASTSYYDTSALKHTLENLVDFDRINANRDMRLSVGAVNLRNGQLVYFDSAKTKLRVEHIMASAALPPGFPAIEIDGEHYWDGGMVSNTPLEYVLNYYPRDSRLCFQVDLFPSYGMLPSTLDQVAEREKDIRYSSRTRASTMAFRQLHELRCALNELSELVSDDIKNSPTGQRVFGHSCITSMDIVQLIYRPFEPQGPQKDYEFGRPTMLARWIQGAEDARATLQAAPWIKHEHTNEGVRLFDVIHDKLVREVGEGARAKTDTPAAARLKAQLKTVTNTSGADEPLRDAAHRPASKWNE